MRLSRLFLSVLLFVTASEFAAAQEGAGEVTTQSNASRRADRQLSRQMRRAHRGQQIDALREHFGHGTRTGGLASSLQAENSASLRMIAPMELECTLADGEMVIDDEAAIDDEVVIDDMIGGDDGAAGEQPEFLGPPIQIDPNSEGGEGFWEGFPVEDDEYCEHDRPKIMPWWRGGDDEHVIYTLSGAAGGELQNRNNDAAGATAETAAFAPLEKLRGKAQGNAAVDNRTSVLPAAAGNANFDVALADRILAKRLADIDRLRDTALRNGNLELLDKADKLEAIARGQHERRTADETPAEPTGESTAPAQ